MKIRATFLSCLCIAFFCVSQAQELEDCLLWRIEKQDFETCYLYGTMHSKDDRVFHFSDSLMYIFDDVEALAVEVHPDSLAYHLFHDAIAQQIRRQALDVGYDEYWSVEDFEEMLGKPRYSKLERRLKKELGISLDNMKNRNPYILEQSLPQASEGDSLRPVFLDFYLCDLARRCGKNLYGLESVTESMELYDDVHKEHSSQSLSNLLDLLENKEFGEKMTQLYMDQNISELDSLYADTTQVSKDFYEQILIKRNYGMAENMRTLGIENSTFFAVGAAHLPGREGLISLMRNEGYKVTAVLSQETGLHGTYEFKYEEYNWERYEDERAGFSYAMPCEPFSLEIPFSAAKLQMAMDLTTNRGYMALGMPVLPEARERNEKTTLKKMVDMYAANAGYHIFDEETVEVDGCVAKNVLIGAFLPSIRMNMMVKDNKMFYIMGVTYESPAAYDEDDAQKFFDSVKFHEVANSSWELYESPEGAFSVMIPGPHLEQNFSYNEGTEYEVPAHMVIGVDNNNGSQFIVNYFDIPWVDQFESDSVFLCQSLEAAFVEQGLRMPPVERTDYGRHEAYTAIGRTGDAYLGACCALRGNRFFMLVASVQSEKQHDELDQFFDNFRFGADCKTELEPFEIPSVGSVQVPSGHEEEFFLEPYEFTQYGWEGIDSSGYVQILDKCTGDAFYVGAHWYDEFQWWADSTLCDDLTANFVGYTDSIYSRDTLDFAGRKAFDIEFGVEDDNTRKRMLVVLDGPCLIQLVVQTHVDEIDNPAIEQFISSLELTGEFDSLYFAGPRVDHVLAALADTDTLRQMKARSTFTYLDTSDVSLDKVMALWDLKFWDDSTDQRTRKAIINQLVTYDDDRLAEFALGNYEKFGTDEELMPTYARLIAKAETPDAAEVLVQLLAARADDEDVSFQLSGILHQLDDSIELYGPVASPLLRLISNTEFLYAMTNLGFPLYDGGYVTADMLRAYSPRVEEMYYEELEKEKLADRRGEYYYGEWRKGHMLDYLWLTTPTEEFIDVLEEEYKDVDIDQYSEDLANVFALLIQGDRKISSKKIHTLASYPLSRKPFYQKLTHLDRLDLFPDRFNTQSEMAESDQVEYAYWYDEALPEETEELAVKVVTHKGEDYRLYIHEYKYEWADESSFGTSGLYSIDESDYRVYYDTRDIAYDYFDEDRQTQQCDSLYQVVLEMLADEEYPLENLVEKQEYKYVDPVFEGEGDLAHLVTHSADSSRTYHHYLDANSFLVKMVAESDGEERVVFEIEDAPEIEAPSELEDVALDRIPTIASCDQAMNDEMSLECTNHVLTEWLAARMTLDPTDLEAFESNKVEILFQVEIDGRCSRIEVQSGADEDTRAKIQKLLKEAPEFSPGEKNLEPVAAQVNVIVDCAELVDNSTTSSLTRLKGKDKKLGLAALDAMFEEDYSAAIENLSQLIERHPDDAISYSMRSFSHYQLGNIDPAFKDINQAIKLAPSEADFYVARANIFMALRRQGEALQDCNTAIDLNPYMTDALETRAMLQMRYGEYDEALEDITKAIDMQPYSQSAFVTRAAIYSRLDRFDEALDDLDLVVRNDTGSYYAYATRGMLRGVDTDIDYEGALEDFERALELTEDPLYTEPIYNNMGMVYNNMEEYEKALECYEVLVNSEHMRDYGLSNRSYTKLKMGDVDGALVDINESLEMNEQNSWAYKNKALILIETGDLDGACEALNASLATGFEAHYGDEVSELKAKHCE